MVASSDQATWFVFRVHTKLFIGEWFFVCKCACHGKTAAGVQSHNSGSRELTRSYDLHLHPLRDHMNPRQLKSSSLKHCCIVELC
jgi:hypothetical protein